MTTPHRPKSALEVWIRQGDARECATHFPGVAFDLIYVDPPFFTGRQHRHKAHAAEGFADEWRGDIDYYVEHLAARIAAIRDTLGPEGSLLLHLDWHAVHYVKVACDRLFGYDRFQNEVIWAYRSGGGTKSRYGRKHDTILWYSKGKTPYFDADAARVPYDAVIARKRAHLFDDRGKVSGDVLDISRPPNHAAEWTGWPTQKPLALLEWFVRVHAPPGGVVGDFFCGSGTTLVAAATSGRTFRGCDISPDAVAIARHRISATPIGVRPVDIPQLTLFASDETSPDADPRLPPD